MDVDEDSPVIVGREGAGTDQFIWRATKIPRKILRPPTPLSTHLKKTAQSDVTAKTALKSLLKSALQTALQSAL